jgi:acyl-coenzyme A thioesterase PaaI-like protein
MRIDYLRPCVGEWFDASATVPRSGSRVVVRRMAFRNGEGTLVAVGTGTYMVE